MIRLILATVLALGLSSTLTRATCPQGTLDEAKASETALANFAVEFYKGVSAANRDKNTVLSPTSVALGLAVLESGASGTTRDKIKALIGSRSTAALDVLTSYSALQKQLHIADENTKLTVVNGVFPDKDFSVKPEFVQAVEECFGGQAEKMDYRGEQREESRRKINRWVSERTAGKIPELLKTGSLSGNVALVMANALYFKGQWRYGFIEAQTEPGQFYRFGRQQDTQSVSYMKQSAWFGYSGSDENVEILEMSYTNRDLSMYVFLPKTTDGLTRFERELTGEKLKTLIANVRTQYVRVSMPRFGIRSSIDLKEHLRDLGLDVLFSDRADFSHLTEAPVKVSKALHEAYVKINEDGTEASASTGFVWIARSNPPQNPPQFNVDHPFIYVIKHKPTGAILFLGRVNFIEDN